MHYNPLTEPTEEELKILNTLNAFQLKAVELYMGGRTEHQITKALGISPTAYYKIILEIKILFNIDSFPAGKPVCMTVLHFKYGFKWKPAVKEWSQITTVIIKWKDDALMRKYLCELMDKDANENYLVTDNNLNEDTRHHALLKIATFMGKELDKFDVEGDLVK